MDNNIINSPSKDESYYQSMYSNSIKSIKNKDLENLKKYLMDNYEYKKDAITYGSDIIKHATEFFSENNIYPESHKVNSVFSHLFYRYYNTMIGYFWNQYCNNDENIVIPHERNHNNTIKSPHIVNLTKKSYDRKHTCSICNEIIEAQYTDELEYNIISHIKCKHQTTMNYLLSHLSKLRKKNSTILDRVINNIYQNGYKNKYKNGYTINI